MAITFTENTLTFVFNGMDMTVTNDAISTQIDASRRLIVLDGNRSFLLAVVQMVAKIPDAQMVAYMGDDAAGLDIAGTVQTVAMKARAYEIAVALCSVFRFLNAHIPLTLKPDEVRNFATTVDQLTAINRTAAQITTWVTTRQAYWNTHNAERYAALQNLLMCLLQGHSVSLRMTSHHFREEDTFWARFTQVVAQGVFAEGANATLWDYMVTSGLAHDIQHWFNDGEIARLTFNVNADARPYIDDYILVRVDALGPLQVRVAVGAVIWNRVAAITTHAVATQIATLYQARVATIKGDLEHCCKYTAPQTQQTHYGTFKVLESATCMGQGIIQGQKTELGGKYAELSIACAKGMAKRDATTTSRGVAIGRILATNAVGMTLAEVTTALALVFTQINV